MSVKLNLPPEVEKAYFAEARAKGVTPDELMGEVLIVGRPAHPAADTVFQQGLGLFGSPEDAALLDEAVAAIAVRLQMPPVTGNTRDFRAIQKTGIKLTIEN